MLLGRSLVVLVCLGVSLTLAQQSSGGDLETVLSQKLHYSMLLDLLRTSGLLDQLKQAPKLTLFAPTNQVLSDIPRDEYNDLKSNMAELTEFLQFHVSTDVAWHHIDQSSNDLEIKSLRNDLPIRINVYWQLHTVSAEGINITERNVPVSNGYVQGIDGVMYPPDGDVVHLISEIDDTQTMARLINTAGLADMLRNDHNITVFAPSDPAFDDMDDSVMNYLERSPNLLKEVLLYHVVEKTTLYTIGMRHQMTFPSADNRHDSLMLLEASEDDNGDFFLNHARMVERDLSATNGVLHMLEAVLMPPSVLIQLEDQGLGHLLG